MTGRLTFKDKLDRVLPRLEDEAEAFLTHCFRKPDETTRHHYKWSKESGLFYHRTGRYAHRFHSYGNGWHGDLIDFCARFFLHRPEAKGDALREAMAWLGLSDDRPLPDEKEAAKRRRERQEKREREAVADAKKDAYKSAEATRRIENGLHPAGTPLEHYATIERAIPVVSWPACAVYDPQERAAAFAVTDDAGTIWALQHVALTPDGKQDKQRYPGERAKNDLGRKTKGVVRFAGDRDGYHILGEGPETTWTGNVASGFPAWACLGGMYHAVNFNLGGRTIIVLRDDDAETSGGYRAAVKAIRDLRAAGHEVIEVWPFEQHRGNGDDFNDLAQESGIDAVRDRIEQAIARHSHARFELPLDKSEERVNAIASQFFEEAEGWDKDGEEAPPVHAAGFSVGVGKTESVLNHGSDFLHNARQRQSNVAGVHAVPEHKLSNEIAERFNRMSERKGYGLTAKVWRGREALRPDASGLQMCASIDDIKDAQAVYVDDIEKEVCGECSHHPNNGGACAYLAQRGEDADYWIVSHNLMFAEVPAAINKRGIGFAVVDEAIWQAGLKGTDGKGAKIVIDSLLPAAGMIAPPGDDGRRLKAIREDLASVLLHEPDGWVKRDAIKRANIQDDTAAFARKQEWLRKVDRKQEPNWRKRDANKDLGRMTALWSAIDHLMSSADIDLSGRLRLVTEEGVRVLYVYGRDDIAAGWRAPTIAIDALHKPNLLAHYFPNVEDKGDIRTATPHMIVEQATHDNWAKTYLDPTMGEGDTKKKRDKRRQAKALILKQTARIGGKVLLVGQKEVVGAIKKTGLPSNIDVAWYGAVAGRDHWRDVDGIILLGAPEPTSSQVERMAGALTGFAPSPVGTPDGRYPKADAERFLRKGRTIVSIPADGKRHPDDLAETIRQHVTIGQIIQAAGRGRGVRRGAGNPLRVIALTGAVLPFPVDSFLTEADTAATHADLQIAEGGIAFEDGTSAAAAYPDLYPSPAAARKAFAYERVGEQKASSQTLIGISIRDTHDAFAVTIQKAGNGQRTQRAWVHPSSCPDPRAAIEAALGPLSRFEAVEQQQEAEAVPVVIGSAAVAVEPVEDFHTVDMREEAHLPLSVLLSAIQGPLATPQAWAAYRAAGFAAFGRWALARHDELTAAAGDKQDEATAAPQNDDDEDGDEIVSVGRDWWDELQRRTSDAGLRRCDVAHGAGMSAADLSNCQAGRRHMTKRKVAAIEAYLATVPRQQGRLL